MLTALRHPACAGQQRRLSDTGNPAPRLPPPEKRRRRSVAAHSPLAAPPGSARGCPCPGAGVCFLRGAWRAKRRKHRASEAQDGRSERPAKATGSPERLPV